MSVAFDQSQELGRGDLDIFTEDADGNPVNVYEISYALYYVDTETGSEVLIGPSARTPVNPAVGEYYAAMRIPSSATPGCYRIRWLLRETAGASQEGAVQEFGVVAETSLTADPYDACIQNLINKMRVLTRDNNPDANYRFRPPEGEGTIGCYNQVFGQIWTDEEFAEYLEIALWKWNIHPPNTDQYNTIGKVCQRKPSWQVALLWGALVNAAQALAYQWTSEDFSVAPETLVTVHLPDGREVSLPIEELHEICTERV
jgi:hypothetical protein